MKMKKNPIPIIDLFAGPGGLAEGFCRLENAATGAPSFDGLLSVEKDAWAHQTLQLRHSDLLQIMGLLTEADKEIYQ